MKKKEKLKLHKNFNQINSNNDLIVGPLDLGSISSPVKPGGDFYKVCSYEWYSYSFVNPTDDDGAWLCVDLKDQKEGRHDFHGGLKSNR